MSRSVVLFFALALCFGAFAWQSAMSAIGLTAQDVDAAARDGGELNSALYGPALSNQVRLAAKALGEQQRVAVVREFSAALKALVMSDAFQKAHEAAIRTSRHAMNHGVKVEAAAPPTIQQMQSQGAAGLWLVYKMLPIDALKESFAEDQSNYAERYKDPDESAEEKAKVGKLLARAKAIAPLMKSNPEEFRKAYTVMKSVEIGGPDSFAALEAMLNEAEERPRKMREQQAWNEYNFKVVLKKKLAAFVNEAASVDFAAQTADVSGKKRFTNDAYEGKSYMWKAMYRAGKAPTTTALEFARAWLKEL